MGDSGTSRFISRYTSTRRFENNGPGREKRRKVNKCKCHEGKERVVLLIQSQQWVGPRNGPRPRRSKAAQRGRSLQLSFSWHKQANHQPTTKHRRAATALSLINARDRVLPHLAVDHIPHPRRVLRPASRAATSTFTDEPLAHLPTATPSRVTRISTVSSRAPPIRRHGPRHRDGRR